MSNSTPSIRFKGFTEDWELHKLDELVNIFDGTHQTPKYQSSGIMFLSVEDINTLKSNKFISEEAFKKEYKVYPQYGDILMTRIGDVGTPNVVKDDTLKAFYVSLALLKPRWIDSNFLCSNILSPAFKKELKQRTLTTAIPQKINKDQIGQINTIVPKSLEEQKKIGYLFENISNLIVFNQRKHDNLLKMKKSLLEKLFPNNGETIPSIRFEGFTEGWGNREAKELCYITTGKSNTQDQVEDGKYIFFIRSDIPVRSNRYLYDEEAVITIGDGNIGRVFHYINGKFDLHQRCYKMANFRNLTAKYFYYFFSTKFYDRAMSMTAKATVDSVRLEMISDMDIKYPINLEEQSKIAALLTKLDSVITLHQRKVDILKKIKASLLEQMFAQ